MNRQTLLLFAAICATLVLSSPLARAVDYTWDGAGVNDFFNLPQNWNATSAVAPFYPNDNTDKAIFNVASDVDFIAQSIPDVVITNQSFEVRAGTTTFNLYRMGVQDPTATYRLQPPSGTLPLAAIVGTMSGESATLIVSGALFQLPPPAGPSEIEAQGALRIAAAAGGTGRVDIGILNQPWRTTWTSNSLTQVATGGTGTLNVFANNSLIDAGAQIGVGGTAHGTVNIRGAWTNNGDLLVGLLGDGDLNILTGAVTTHGDATIGTGILGTPSGRADVTGGDWSIDGLLTIGTANNGAGVLNVNSAASTVTVGGAMNVRSRGDVDLPNGQLTVNGALTLNAGSTLDLAGGHLKTSPATFTIPASTFNWTSGTLEFTTAYTVETGHLLGGASFTVGANKEFIVNGALGIGTGAAGTFTVNGGGMVSGTSVNLGGMASAGTSASATISGASSMWDIAGTITVADDFAANLTIDAGGVLNTASSIASNAAGSTSNIDLTGANTLWANSGSAHFGGSAIAVGGPGTLDITTGAKMTVGNLLKVWEPFTVTVNGGTIETAHLDALGTINVQGTGTVKATGNVNITSGADVTISPNSTFDVAGATITVTGGATVAGAVTANAMTSATVSSAGTTWTMPGSLEIGTASSGFGRIGLLALQTGSTTNVGGDVTVTDVSKFTLAGGTLNAMSFDVGNQDFSGFGAINARFSTGGDVTATGNLTIGDANSFNGVQIGGNLNVGMHTVTINKKGFFNVGQFTEISGGTLAAPGGVSLPTGNALAATGAVNARIAAQAGSTIEATGNLALGDTTAVDGYFSDGVLLVNERTVTLNDANQAVLGSLTQLGRAGMPGTLVASNGAAVELGKNVVGFGTLDTPNNPLKPLVNNGHIGGNSAMEKITLNGYVKGVGTFDNATFAGTLSPGFSPATINMGGNVEFGSSAKLEIEIGGLTPGTQHDRINIAGQATLNGTLELSLINGFVPSPGHSFTVMTFGSRTGTFSQIVQPPAAQFNTIYSATDLVLVAILPTGEKIWAVDANGNTSVGSNWTGGVAPGGVGDVAVFGSVITAPRMATVDVPFTAGRLDFNNANTFSISGANAITLDVLSGNTQINVINGSHVISAPVTLADDVVINVAPTASNLSVSGPLGASGRSVTKSGAGTLTVNNVRAAGLTVNGGQVVVAPNGAAIGTSVLNALTLAGATNAWTSKLDVSNNDAVFQSTAANKAADFARLYNQLRQGFNSGDWLGMGITSASAATNTSGETGLSLVDNALLGYTDVSGQAVTADSILLKYTYYGDIDQNGQVDADDLTVFGNSFGRTSGATQVDGDIDFNGTVDADDLTVFGNNFNKGIGNPLLAQNIQAVPEPSTLIVLLVATLCVATQIRPLRGAFAKCSQRLLTPDAST